MFRTRTQGIAVRHGFLRNRGTGELNVIARRGQRSIYDLVIFNLALDPFAALHDWLRGAVVSDPANLDIFRSDHEIDVDCAPVASGSVEFLIVHRVATVYRKFVSRPERDMAGRILIEEGVVEQQPGLRDRRAVGNERHLAESSGARIGFHQLAQHGFAALGGQPDNASVYEMKAEVFDHGSAKAERF